MTSWLWAALFCQMAMGAFDTIYHHEGTERLAWRPDQAGELRLHGVRNLAYAVMFGTLGWFEPRGFWAIALMALMGGELLITLWDFVEEDRTRKLPATERVTHTLLTLNYGVVLALLLPWLIGLSAAPADLVFVDNGILGWLCAVAAIGVIISGLRDLAAAGRCPHLRRGDAAILANALPARTAVLVTGGTGFVGSRLIETLLRAGHDVTVLTRCRANAVALAMMGPVRVITSLDQIASDEKLDAIVNLAGEPISNGPWTRAKRLQIVRSRLLVTNDVVRLIKRLEEKPSVLISGSAIGWYGLRDDQPLTEANLGTPCFSRRICVAWERAAVRAEKQGVRTVLLRTGLVLDSDGGMLARMLAPFEFGLGGRFGNGHQWMSWIHRDDLVRLVLHCIATPALQGPVNATAPEPVTNRVFTMSLARALARPAVIPVPAWPLRAALGDFAEELLLHGQRVFPQAAQQSGFRFFYPTIDQALQMICGCRPQTMAKAMEVKMARAHV
jgi:uncharacterized protein